MLNLFIAVVVNAMQSKYHEVEAEHAEAACAVGAWLHCDTFSTIGWWARQDSNLRPTDYESVALTN